MTNSAHRLFQRRARSLLSDKKWHDADPVVAALMSLVKPEKAARRMKLDGYSLTAIQADLDPGRMRWARIAIDDMKKTGHVEIRGLKKTRQYRLTKKGLMAHRASMAMNASQGGQNNDRQDDGPQKGREALGSNQNEGDAISG